MGIRMRRLAALTAGLTALVLGLSACGSAGSDSDDPDTVTYAIDTDFLGLDPNTTPQAQDARAARQIYDNLLAKDDKGKIVGWLATEFAQLDGGKRFTFTLRDGVKFHDGTDLDAQAVCDNFDRITDPKAGSRYAISLLGPYESCKTHGKLKFEVDFKRAYSPFFEYLTSPFLSITSPTAVKKYGDQFNFHPVGSGPFMFDSYTVKNQLVLKANPDYNWGPPTSAHTGPPKIKKLIFQIITDPTVRVGSLRSGGVDAIGNIPETDAGTLQQDPSLEFFAKAQSGAPYQLHLNTKRDLFKDVKVRQAFVKSVNVPSINKALYFGVYDTAIEAISPTTGGFDDSLQGTISYDPEGAKKLLDEAGWKPGPDGVRVKDGKRLTIHTNDVAPNREKRQDVAQFVYSYAKKVGFEVKSGMIQTAEAPAYVQAGKYDIYGLSLVNASANVLSTLYGSENIPTAEKYAMNISKVDDLDDKLQAAQTEPDESKRTEIYRGILKYALDRAYALPIYVPTYTVATKGIKGLTFDAEAYPSFYGVEPADGDN
ncbi:ABC transporter substrate-binding protein [Brevibacterium sp. 50QC2O2]|uniref:ABC transporter substrate-binding protein n=1 Tax=Brevibacterium sp. 50QC2O2 TaxID=2968459 RepID=UPI00211D14F2|nr:ABC transporter substrate-binding protein [Brevibacterium sp. 50QC2O2]MCQ9389563.1 ABC transporter substrate-binding protein [Brevibacterium sp. 50QC2O2]